MGLKASLYERLKDDAAVAVLCGSRVYPAVVPQGAAMPAVSFLLVSRQEQDELEGGIGVWEATVQVSCWGDTYDEADQLADAVRDCLQDFSGSMGIEEVTVIDDCRQIGETDLVIPPAGDDGRYHVPLDFEITYQE